MAVVSSNRKAGSAIWVLMGLLIPTVAWWSAPRVVGEHAQAVETTGQGTVHPTNAAVTAVFDVNWPVVDPAVGGGMGQRFLEGELSVRCDGAGTDRVRAVIGVTLTRPHANEGDRAYWNRKTRFPQYASWMPYVWDADEKWLWPNVAYLFTIHGRDREERYGGWDRGHHDDNDFGGILIRKYDAAGEVEHADTREAGPLVSAAWRAVGVKDADRETVAHVARSEEFTVHLADAAAGGKGRIKVWFVYGDFMKFAMPKRWPKVRECNGAAIAFFDIDWSRRPGRAVTLTLSQKTPPPPTGFDWTAWIGRSGPGDTPVATSRLSDRSSNAGLPKEAP